MYLEWHTVDADVCLDLLTTSKQKDNVNAFTYIFLVDDLLESTIIPKVKAINSLGK
jgi:hypothetical protein